MNLLKRFLGRMDTPTPPPGGTGQSGHRKPNRIVPGHRLLNELGDVLGLPKETFRIEISGELGETAEIIVWMRVREEQSRKIKEVLQSYQLLDTGQYVPDDEETALEE